MKIGILGPFPPFRGGIATFDAHLTRQLRSRADVVPLNYHTLYPRFIFPGKTQLDVSRKPFPAEAVPAFHPFRPWRWRENSRYLAGLQLDWLLLSWWTPLFAPGMISVVKAWKRKTGGRLAVVCHNVLPHERIPLGRFLQRRLLAQASLLVTHWQGDAALLRQWFPRAGLLPLFHPLYQEFPDDPRLDRAGARRELGIPGTARQVLLFFGLIRPYKGLEVLLAAFRHLLREGAGDYCLLVAGEFYVKRKSFDPVLAELLGSGQVLLHDRFIANEEVFRYFRAADMVVLPYHHATQSGVIPLAYQWGRGVISTRVGGLEEVVEPGRSGYLVEAGDVPGLAGAIRQFSDNQNDIEAYVPNMARKLSFDNYGRALREALMRQERSPESRKPD